MSIFWSRSWDCCLLAIVLGRIIGELVTLTSDSAHSVVAIIVCMWPISNCQKQNIERSLLRQSIFYWQLGAQPLFPYYEWLCSSNGWSINLTLRIIQLSLPQILQSPKFAHRVFLFVEKSSSSSLIPSEHDVNPFYFYPYTHNGASVRRNRWRLGFLRLLSCSQVRPVYTLWVFGIALWRGPNDSSYPGLAVQSRSTQRGDLCHWIVDTLSMIMYHSKPFLRGFWLLMGAKLPFEWLSLGLN